MKIAIVRQRYNPFGGAERFVERALGALSEQGSQVTLITRNWDGAPHEGFRQVTCDPPYSRLLGREARDRSFAQAVQVEWARGEYDITQSHERIPGCMIFRAGDGVHAAWLEHRASILSPLQRAVQKLSGFHRYLLKAEREMFAHSALRAVICNSQMVADEISCYYGVERERLHVIYNGVDTEDFHPSLREMHRTHWRSEMGIPQSVPLLLFVGSGFERKGLPQLLRAFSAMKIREAHLVVVGSDRKLRAMKSLASRLKVRERVLFTGGLSDVRPCYGAADAFVLPTLYDPCPNAALEALSSGLPIVTSRQCGASEWVKNDDTGWVVDALDERALRIALEDVCKRAGDMAFRAAARRSVEALSLAAMSTRLLALYRRLGAAPDV